MMRSFQCGLRTGWIVVVSVLCVAALPCHADVSNPAERSLLMGHVDEATAILNARLAANPADGAAHLLLCRALYAQELPAPAVKECEAALANGLAGNSQAQDWMGRVYGRKADNAGPFEGLKLAGKVKSAFEAAVQLDPANGSAANDLSEYYVGAPAIVGGGLDKATALADRVAARLPQPSHRIRARCRKEKRFRHCRTRISSRCIGCRSRRRLDRPRRLLLAPRTERTGRRRSAQSARSEWREGCFPGGHRQYSLHHAPRTADGRTCAAGIPGV